MDFIEVIKNKIIIKNKENYIILLTEDYFIILFFK